MFEILSKTKTLICIGTGGVGKTTMAAAIGLGKVNEGKKVLVLTIDPSLRLAQALGIKTDGEIYSVYKADNGGELFACVIDHQKTFNYFIQNSAGKDIESEFIKKLLNNKLYKQLSGRLSGSQDFTSLISLYRHVSSRQFDLVILDTPPSQHTWNFLRAPEKISNLFNEGVAKWFREANSENQGIFKKILNVGTSQVLKALESLTGSLFIKELSEFFLAIQRWQAPLETYVMNCHRLLTSQETEFVLITNLDLAKLNEAQKLIREIKIQGYRLTSIVINRMLKMELETSEYPKGKISNYINYYQSLENQLKRLISHFKNQLNVYKCFELRQNSENIECLKKTYNEMSRLD